MAIEEIKDYALRSMIKEHLWEVGEADNFVFDNIDYRIEKVDEDGFLLKRYNIETNNWNGGKFFSTLGRLFGYFFRVNFIKI